MAIHALGLSGAIALQSSNPRDTVDQTEVYPALSVLLSAIEWSGRNLVFRLDKLDSVAFHTATSHITNGVLSNPHPWGFAEWWEWTSQGPIGEQCPRWWKDPPPSVVSVRTLCVAVSNHLSQAPPMPLFQEDLEEWNRRVDRSADTNMQHLEEKEVKLRAVTGRMGNTEPIE